MSKIETRSKVSLNLTSRINLEVEARTPSSRLSTEPISTPAQPEKANPGRRDPHAPNPQPQTQPTSPPSQERAIPDQQRPIVPTETINNPLWTAKVAPNGNHRPCLKSKPQVNCHRSLPAG